MAEISRRYTITAYTEWETLDVEAECPDDEHAVDKARRYGSLKYLGTNFPAVIFAHIACHEEEGLRDVGTWEYRLRHTKKTGFFWHEGHWPERPMPEDRLSLRRWPARFANAGHPPLQTL
jgi:hypothetical protein